MKPRHDISTRFLHSWFLRICLGLYAVAALLILFLGRGSFRIFLLVFSLIIYVGAPLFLGSLVFWAVARYRRKNSWILYAKRGLTISLCLAALMLPVWGADRVARDDVARARTFCESLLPELNDIHARTGTYPADISELTSYRKPPCLLRRGSCYHSDGGTFTFSFDDKSRLFGPWILTSSEQTWQYLD